MARLSSPDFDHVKEPALRDLIDFWLAARGDQMLPAVEAIDPVLFPKVLGNIWMCDVVDRNPRGRWMYRLVGENVRRAYTVNIVGRTLEEVTAASAVQRVVGYFSIATDWPAIVHVIGRVYAEAPRPARGERLILPFISPTEKRVSRLLGATVHSWQEIGYSIGDIPLDQTRTYTRIDNGDVLTETSPQ